MSYRKFFEEQWSLFQSAGVYLPRENPTFRNPEFEAARSRVLIVRLSPYRDVDRSTPHLFLYQAVRRAQPEAYVDVAFFPPEHDRARFAEAGVPFLVGVQSLRAAHEFDLVLISNAYLLELINLPYLFLKSDIPPMASERDAKWPIFVLGGSNALAAQALITPSGDSFVDALFFGEGEGEVEALAHTLLNPTLPSKAERLDRAAASVKGLWLANRDAPQHVTKALCPTPRADDLLTDYPLLNGAEAGTARLQINYGCPAFCAFCFEGYDRKPYREVPLDDVLTTARQLKRKHGPEVLELTSFNFNTYADILTLLLDLSRLFNRVGLKSQRIDFLYRTPLLLDAEVAADKHTFTLGIEGLSARLRAFLQKDLQTETITGMLERLLHRKIRELKLFYILTGHETEADLAEFHAFIGELRDVRRRLNRRVRVVVSAGRLVRMPFTPLRHDRLFLDEDDWTSIVGAVKSACETQGAEFRLATPWADYAVSQVLALGGYWLHEPLIALAKQGYCYDTELDPAYWEALRAWMQAQGYWNAAFLGEKGPDYDFPLAFVEGGVRKGFLYEVYQQAKAGVERGTCLGREEATGTCLGCDACFSLEQKRDVVMHTVHIPQRTGFVEDFSALMRTKRRLDPLYVRVRVPAFVAHTDPTWLNAWVFRYLLQTYPALESNLLSVQEALFTHHALRDRFPVPAGELCFALRAWDVDDVLWELAAPAEADAHGTRFLGVAEDFTPGEFTQLQLRLALPVAHFPKAGQRLRRYLQEQYVANNVRREGETYRFVLPEKALKKRWLFGGTYTVEGAQFVAQLEIGPKFDLLGYLRSFGAPGREREAHIEVLTQT
ncbi:MAG: radical SAM protein [Anaerolineae bacterium]